jgi:hypothetical protein
MSRTLSFLLILLTSIPLLHGQNAGPAARDSITEKTVQLKPLTMAGDSDKTVILVQSDSVEIQTTLSRLRNNLGAWVKNHPRLYDDKILYSNVQKDYPGKEVLIARDIAPHSELMNRLKFRTADLLENGECRVIDNKDNSNFREITVKSVTHDCGPGCGYTERRFYGGNVLIFKVVDKRK